ncbi:alpha/beta fold hydrolase [Streptomyces sp. NPDC004111]|uniref:alpha/beta fold hydrolase n=1 Tax=Streptomyces sp. NPDC004111 TaxID=3364690 RepID=UPI00368E9D13
MTSAELPDHLSPTAPLHVRDHGGDGPPLLLLHGATRSHADWASIVPHLLPEYRVLAVDLPAHGGSPAPAVWTLEAALDAIEATLRQAGAPDAVLVGHSLGGMLAALYAARHPGVTPAAVNLDGFWWGAPGPHPDVERVRDLVRAPAGAVMPADYVAQQVRRSALFGIPAERAEAAVRVAARELPDGRWQTLPLREHALEMFDSLDTVDFHRTFRSVACPLLLVRAERAMPRQPGTEWFDAYLEAYGKELDRELAGMPAHVSVRGIDATHLMPLEAPEAVASLVREFLAGR